MTSDELSLIISENTGGCSLKCWIQPRSSRNAVVGVHGDAIKIALTAPPIDGKANKELLKFLAKYFKLSKSDLHLVSGESLRAKIIRINGLNKEAVIKELCSE
ncbi:MAG: YggU family protein [Victivallales bacterium]|nr:YggU family protein [Victivallales bacterium]